MRNVLDPHRTTSAAPRPAPASALIAFAGPGPGPVAPAQPPAATVEEYRAIAKIMEEKIAELLNSTTVGSGRGHLPRPAARSQGSGRPLLRCDRADRQLRRDGDLRLAPHDEVPDPAEPGRPLAARDPGRHGRARGARDVPLLPVRPVLDNRVYGGPEPAQVRRRPQGPDVAWRRIGGVGRRGPRHQPDHAERPQLERLADDAGRGTVRPNVQRDRLLHAHPGQQRRPLGHRGCDASKGRRLQPRRVPGRHRPPVRQQDRGRLGSQLLP